MLQDFTKEYQRKLRTPQEAAAVVKSGDWVDYTSCLGKPVLLDWYADWCISCKVIERQVLTDPTVQARLPAYRLLRFDITESNPAQRGLLDRYNLFGPPAILFFAPGGDEWSDLRVIGEIDAAGLAERLRRAATRQ